MDTFICGAVELPTTLAQFSHMLMQLVKILVPIILIFLGMLDLIKGIIQDKGENIKKQTQLLVKRFFSAIMVFLVVTVTQFVFNLVSEDEDRIALNCVNCFVNGLENDNCKGTIVTEKPEKKDILLVNATSVELKLPKNKLHNITVKLNGIEISPEKIIWSSTNTDVATVENGLVTAQKPGYATIKLEYNDYKATVSIRVKRSNCPPEGTKRYAKVKYKTYEFYLYVSPQILSCELDDIPIMVYLSSAGGSADFIGKAGDSIPINIYRGTKDYQGIIIVPQNPGRPSWVVHEKEIYEITKYIEEEFNANPDRISIAGYSWGANGAWEVAYRHSDYFYAIGCVSPSWHIWNTPVNKKMSNIFWGYTDCGACDKTGENRSASSFAKQVTKAGGKGYCSDTNHTHWEIDNHAFISNHLAEWLLEQDRSKGLDAVKFEWKEKK